MLNTTHTRRAPKVTPAPAAATMAALALASFGLAACGESSSGGASSQTSAAAKTLSLIAKARSARSAAANPPKSSSSDATHSAKPRTTGIRACLEKSGAIAKGASHSPLAGGVALRGAKRAQFTAALRKCLGVKPVSAGATAGAVPHPPRAPRFKQALAKYAACLHQNGVPASKGSAGGLLGLQGVDRSSPKYKSATMKCRGVLAAALRGGR